MGKTWLVQGEAYQFNGYTIIGEQLILSTDRKILMYPAADIAIFLKALLPVETGTSVAMPKKTAITRVDAQSQSDLATMRQAMMQQFANIQEHPTEVNLLRAKHMGAVAATYMNLVKTEISLHKLKS